MEFNEMKQMCINLLYQDKISQHAKIGDAACVIISNSDRCYTGLSLVASANVGFCAEQAAISEMIKNHETIMKQMLVLDKFGNVFPPCGKCLELITALNEANRNCVVFLSDDSSITIEKLYPVDWKIIKDDFKKSNIIK